MKNEDNIDRLYQESFKDFEVSPPGNAWQNIERRLKADSRKRVIPLWRRLTAAVAIIAILIVAVSQSNTSPQVQNSSITDNSTNETPENTIDNSNSIPPKQESNPISIASTSNENTRAEGLQDNKTQNSDGSSTKSKSSLSSTESQTIAMAKDENIPSEAQFAIGKRLTSSNTVDLVKPEESSSSVMVFPQNLNITQLSDHKENTNQSEISLVEVANLLALEDEKNKVGKGEDKFKSSWFIKPQISPVFYGNMASGSAVDENLAQNSSQGEVDLSYGLNVGYQLSEKVKIRTGINRVNLNYTTNDLFALPGSAIASLSNVNSANGVIASVVTTQQLDDLVDSQTFGRQEAIASDLRQSIGYIEFPLEVEYKLLDRKFGINIIGGASTFLLNNNSIDIVNAEGTTSIGEANNINNLSFSTNFALGFDYSLSNRVLLNLEPTFKYQLNTFESGTTDFQPYFLGVYTGFIFKF